MATTATITITSSDMSDNTISISNTMTLTKAGGVVDIPYTTGLKRRNFAATTIKDLVNLFKNDDLITASKAAKVYVKNVGTATDKHVKIGIGNIATGDSLDAEEIGRLYGGDWMMFPYDATLTGGSNHANNADIYIIPSTADSVDIEWCVFYE
tara:strand:+ start:129 stop:587 length:459 start_codon:yes stop_codon:yes gene_type:complete